MARFGNGLDAGEKTSDCPIVLSDAAVADILEQSDWYQEQSGDKLARSVRSLRNGNSCIAIHSRPFSGLVKRRRRFIILPASYRSDAEKM